MKAAVCVVLQFVLCTAIVFSLGWGDWERGSLTIGLVLIGSGLALTLWGWGSIGWWRLRIMPDPPQPTQDGGDGLVTGGAFAYARHPMYTGVLIAMFGCWIIAPTWWSLVSWFALVGVLLAKSRFEEELLSERHPEYVSYRQRTGRFVPKLSQWKQHLRGRSERLPTPRATQHHRERQTTDE